MQYFFKLRPEYKFWNRVRHSSTHLLPGDGHVVCHPRKYCWLDEVAFVPQPGSPTLQAGSLSLALLNVAQYTLHLLLAYLSLQRDIYLNFTVIFYEMSCSLGEVEVYHHLPLLLNVL